MAEPTTVNATSINTFLAVWGFAAPLIAGAATALWNRKNNIEDRTYQRKVVIEDRKTLQEIEEKNKNFLNQERTILLKKEKLLEYLKKANTLFHSGIHLFTSTPGSPEQVENMKKYMNNIGELTQCHNELFFLGITPELNDKLEKMINIFQEINLPEFPNTEKLKQAGKIFAELKHDILILGKSLLIQEKNQVENPIADTLLQEKC